MAGFGRFGRTLKSIEASKFFDWFGFEAVGIGAYKPSGEAFRDLVWLQAQLSEDKDVVTLSIAVKRSMIADARQGAFARDLVKSFLMDVTGGDRDITALANEIFFRDPVGTMLMRGDPSPLPSKPSNGYRVFSGEVQTWETEAGGVKLKVFNRYEGEAAQFLVSARRKPSRGWLARLRGR